MTADPDDPVLEREEQLASLVGAVEQARRGDGGRLVLLAGEAGAGKSTLVRALAAAVVPRRVVVGWCDLLATPRPLGALLDIARSEGLPLAPDGGVAAVGAIVLDHLACASAPVLVVEDLHWADTATLDLVRFVGRRIRSTRGVVVVTYRDDEVGPDHPAGAVIGDLVAREGVLRVHVPPLSVDATGALLAGRSLDARRVHAVTGGNAFLVSEIAATGTMLPGTVAEAVSARLIRLDPAARTLAEVVCLSPRSLEVDVALRVADVGSDPLDRALACGVLVEEGDRVGFRHELARAAAEASLPPGRRRRGHGLLLAVLEECGGHDLARLVHHAVRAGDGDAVLRLGPVAAEQAVRHGAPGQAVSFLEAALEALDGRDPVRCVELRLQLIRAGLGLDRDPEMFAHADRAVADARALPQPDRERLLPWALIRRAYTSFWLEGRPGDHRKDNAEALELLTAAGDEHGQVQALRDAIWFALIARRRDDAHRLLDRLAPLVDGLGDDWWRRCYLRARGAMDLSVGDGDRGEATLRSVIEEPDVDRRTLALTTGELGLGAVETRRYGTAAEMLACVLRVAEELDADGWARFYRAWQARLAVDTGQLDRAVTIGRRVVGEAEGPAIRVVALGAVGRALARAGCDGGGAEAALRQAVEIGWGDGIGMLTPAACGLAELLWTREELTAPPPWLRLLHQRVLETDSPWLRGETSWWMWRLGALDTPPAACAEPFALQITGRWREAASAWHAIGAPWEEAMALVDGAAEDRLEALRILEGIGALATADLVRSWLRRADDVAVPRGPQRATRENPAGLTRRQLEVLELVVAGLDNPTIAARLHLSKRTVEHHVGAVFAKLGVEDREAAIGAAAAFGIGS